MSNLTRSQKKNILGSLVAAGLVIGALAVYEPSFGAPTKKPTTTVTTTVTSSTTTTETSTSTSTETETSTTTSTQTQTQTQIAGPGATTQFSHVTIDLENASTSRVVTTPCVTIAGHVYWSVGPIPPTIMWYVVTYANGTTSGQVALTLFGPYSAYTSDPPTPSTAQYNAARFSTSVCGLQNSYVNAPFVEPNQVILYAQDPTNTFYVTVLVYKQ